MRDSDHLARTAAYIEGNPVKAGLAKRAEDWPSSGSFTVDWRRLLSVGVDPWTPPWKRSDAPA